MARLPTVAVQGPGGSRMLINERDFDPENHKLFDAAPKPRAAPAYRVENTSPGWRKVLDAVGEPVGPAYRSKEEAGEALEELTGGD